VSLPSLLAKRMLKVLSFKKYHKEICVISALLVIDATMTAVVQKTDGSWQSPLLLFYVAVLCFIFAWSEVILVLFNKYKGKEMKCRAISRAISYMGVSLTFIAMCEMYQYAVLFHW